MKAVLAVFQRAIVWHYYQKNVLFLLVIVLFAFGFLSGQEHQTIVKQALNSPKLLIYTALLWLIYGLKTILFVLRVLNLSEFRFLFHLRMLNFRQRIVVWLYVSFMLNQLTFLYAVFMVILGIFLGKLLSVVFILLSQLIIILIGAIIYEYRIFQNPETNSIFSVSLPQFFKFRLPATLFYHKYLIFKEPVLLLLVKGFSIFSMLFIIWLYPTDDYDDRLFSISLIIIAASHLRICSEYVYFQNRNLQVFRNLPLAFLYKMAMMFFGYLVIILPEIYLFIMRAHQFTNPIYVLSWILFLISTLVFIHSFQYLSMLTEEVKMKYFFFGFVFVLLLIMYKIPLLLLSVLLLMSGFWIFWKFESLYEPQS